MAEQGYLGHTGRGISILQKNGGGDHLSRQRGGAVTDDLIGALQYASVKIPGNEIKSGEDALRPILLHGIQP